MITPSTAVATVLRELRVAPDVVFDAWLDPAIVAEFITPPPGRTGRLEWVPRVGATFSVEMLDHAGAVTIDGMFLEIDRPRRLAFTWHSSLGGGFDSIVTVTLEPAGERRTLMTIEHARLPEPWRDEHEHGWTEIARQLATCLEG